LASSTLSIWSCKHQRFKSATAFWQDLGSRKRTKL
jgi:hypothetical protein